MSTNLPMASCGGEWSEEYDCVPLKIRLKMLRQSVGKSDNAVASSVVPDVESKPIAESVSVNQKADYDLETENRGSPKLHICSSEMPISKASDNVIGKLLKTEDGVVSFPWQTDVLDDDKILLNNRVACSNCELELGKRVKHAALYEFDDHLDNVVLRERRNMLVSRKLMQSSGSNIGVHCGKFSSVSNLQPDADVEKEKGKNGSIEDMLINKSIIPRVNANHEVSRSGVDGSCHTVKQFSLTVSGNIGDKVSVEAKSSPTCVMSDSFSKPEMAMMNVDVMVGTGSSILAKVKHEPVEFSELCREGRKDMQTFSTGEILPVKCEAGFSEFPGDELDHLSLMDRIKLLSSATSSPENLQSVEFLYENVASAWDVGSEVLESVKPINVSRPRKRRKTATNSIETALEEDAPELLKVLIERGVSLHEIKLYGEGESEDDLDESLNEDSFAELEAVMTQLFSQRQSFLKFPLLRLAKGEKANYCLSCLLSLVEQTRYLQNRKWPVEWGWCRDLQSFIFVFQRHNRIVLERPEYGFATYFFELLSSIPVHWQVKRLVTAMKFTNCGRITVIENKPLVVGEDLSEGEARVLAEYGWAPNTGLGTMLNYCDRVIHDRKQEINSLEWRSKIAKQLMNGYNGGNIISKDMPKKLAEYQSSESVQVKLEP